MGTKWSSRKSKKVNPQMLCCDRKCISQIQNLQDLDAVGCTWMTFKDEHRRALRSAISNKNLPVIIAQIISSYLAHFNVDYKDAGYLMIHHRAVNHYFDGQPLCDYFKKKLQVGYNSTYKELRIGLVGKDDAGKSKLAERLVTGSYVEEWDTEWHHGYRKQWEVKGAGNVLFDVSPIDTDHAFSSWIEHMVRCCDVVAFCFAIHDGDWMDEVLCDLRRIRNGNDMDYESKGVVLIGCQMDRLFDMKSNNDDQWAMMEENRMRAIEFSLERNIPYIETSAKANANVIEMFEQIVYEYWLQRHSDSVKWDC